VVNEKAVAVFIAIFVVLLVLVFVFLPRQHISNSFSTTSVPVNQSNYSTTALTTIAGVTTQPYSSKCGLANVLTLQNTYFADGTYSGWNATGGYGAKPFNITNANIKHNYYGQPWNVTNTTFIATTYNGGQNVVAGNLTSGTFTVTLPYLNFQLVSPDSRLIYVEILKDGVPQIVDHFDTYAAPGGGNATTRLMNASVALIPLLCQNVQVRVVSAAAGTSQSEFNYVAATGFYTSSKQQTTSGILINQSIHLT
jgi:hypothetical protein